MPKHAIVLQQPLDVAPRDRQANHVFRVVRLDVLEVLFEHFHLALHPRQFLSWANTSAVNRSGSSTRFATRLRKPRNAALRFYRNERKKKQGVI